MAENTTSKKLTWSGTKEYRTGVSHVALYVKGGDTATSSDYQPGVAWVGVTAINMSPSGAETTSLYADNEKYLSLLSAEEFGFTIEAYAYPEAFASCNGESELSSGLGAFVTQQARTKFGLACRTEIGTSTDNAGTTNADYEIHIFYNCTASPSGQDFATISDSPEAATMSWECTTDNEAGITVGSTPFKGTAHVRIRKTSANATKVAKLEAALFGTDNDDPYLPKLADIVTLMNAT